MAIQYINARFISRSGGHNALSAAAYRANEKLHCERTGETFDYSNKGDCVYKNILLPDTAYNDKYTKESHPYNNRESIWNAVEHIENSHNRRDSAQLAMELKIALPKELSHNSQVDLVNQFIKENYVDAFGVAADVCIHNKDDGNPHAHVMITMRQLHGVEFSRKKERNMAPQVLASTYGNFAVPDQLNRKWETFQNAYFDNNNIDLKVDPINIIPTVHEGRVRENSQFYDVSEYNDQIKTANAEVVYDQPDLIIQTLENNYAVFDERDITKLVFKQTAYSENENDYHDVLRAVLNSNQIIQLGYGESGRIRYTTKANYEKENSIGDIATSMHGQRDFVIHKRYIQAISERYTLKDEQADALQHIAHSGNITALVGLAGTGKTYTLKSVNALYSELGYQVYGTAISGKAAAGLEQEAGIESKTLATLLYLYKQGGSKLNYLPKHGSVLVVDEAGMIGLNDMYQLMNMSRQFNYKLVLAGDPDQLQPVEKGSPFRAILERCGFAMLDVIRRQRNADERKVIRGLSQGKVGDAVDFYIQKDRLVLSGKDEINKQLFSQWVQYQNDLSQTIILAHQQSDVDQLNQHARHYLSENANLGESTAHQVTISGKSVTKEFAPGERIVFLKNSRELNVKNGQLATINEIEDGIIKATLDGGQQVIFDRNLYSNFDYGYALTVHKSQGVTVNNTLAYLSGHGWDRHLTYVALSRHRDNLHIYANQESFNDIHQLKRGLANVSLRDSVLDYPMQFAIRRGEDPELLAQHAAQKIKGVSTKVKDTWNYLFNYTQYQSDQAKTAFQYKAIEQQRINLQAKKVADFADLHGSVNEKYLAFKKQYGDKWYENDEAKIAYKPIEDAFYQRNEAAYHLYTDGHNYGQALRYNRIDSDQLKTWSESFIHEATVRKFEQATNPYVKRQLATEISSSNDYSRFVSSRDLWKSVNVYNAQHVTFAKKQHIEGYRQRLAVVEKFTSNYKDAWRYLDKSKSEHFGQESDGQNKDNLPKHLQKYQLIANQYFKQSEEIAYQIYQDKEAYQTVLSVQYPYAAAYERVVTNIEKQAERYQRRLDIRAYIHPDTPEREREQIAFKLNQDFKGYAGIARDEGMLWRGVATTARPEAIRYIRANLPAGQVEMFDAVQDYQSVCRKAAQQYAEVQALEKALRKQHGLSDKAQLTDEHMTEEFKSQRSDMFKLMAERHELAYDVNNSYPLLEQWYRANPEKIDETFPGLKMDRFNRHVALHEERLEAQDRVKQYADGGEKDGAAAYQIIQRYGKHAFYIKMYECDSAKIWLQGKRYGYQLQASKLPEEKRGVFDAAVDYDLTSREAAQAWAAIRMKEKSGQSVSAELKDTAYKHTMARNAAAFNLSQYLSEDRSNYVFVSDQVEKFDWQRIHKQSQSYEVIDDLKQYQEKTGFTKNEWAASIQDQYAKGAIYQGVQHLDIDGKSFYMNAQAYRREVFELSLSDDERGLYQRVKDYQALSRQAAAEWVSVKQNHADKQKAFALSRQRNVLAASILASCETYKPYLNFESIQHSKLVKHAEQFENALAKTRQQQMQQVVKPEVNQATTQPQVEERQIQRWDHNKIRDRLIQQAEHVYPQIFGEPKKQSSREMRWENGLVVTLQGAKQGMWFSFSEEKGGDPIEAIRHRLPGSSYVEALEQGAHLAGLSEAEAKTTESKFVFKTDPEADNKRKARAAQEIRNKIEAAQSIWMGTKPIADTVAERYLWEHRNIHTADNMEMRYWPVGTKWVDYNEAGQRIERTNKLPAMVLAIKDKNHDITAIQRTYLDSKTYDKVSFMDNPKVTKGHLKGNLGVIQNGANGRVYIAEGGETGASAGLADPKSTVLTSLSVSNLSNSAEALKAHQPKELIILKDNDGKNAKSEVAFNKAIKTLQDAGLQPIIKTPQMLANKQKTDWNDILQVKGVDGLRKDLGVAIPEYDKNWKHRLDQITKIGQIKQLDHTPLKKVRNYLRAERRALLGFKNTELGRIDAETRKAFMEKGQEYAYIVMQDPKAKAIAKDMKVLDRVELDYGRYAKRMAEQPAAEVKPKLTRQEMAQRIENSQAYKDLENYLAELEKKPKFTPGAPKKNKGRSR
jgi:Ti-type conjugative transfer relaxase TraA